MAKFDAPPEVVGLALLAAADVAGFLSGMLPSLFTIQKFNHEGEARRAIRRGEVIGGTLAIAVGAGASLASDHPLPLIVTTITLVVLLAAYEHALANPMGSSQSMSEG